MAEFLTRSFFEVDLPSLSEAYGRETGAKVAAEVVLRNGIALQIEGKPICTDGYLTFDYKNGTHMQRAVLPYGSIVGVNFRSQNAGTLGFRP